MFLQVGINGQIELQDQAEDFYLGHIRTVFQQCGMGKKGAVMRDATTSHCALEKL